MAIVLTSGAVLTVNAADEFRQPPIATSAMQLISMPYDDVLTSQTQPETEMDFREGIP